MSEFDYDHPCLKIFRFSLTSNVQSTELNSQTLRNTAGSSKLKKCSILSRHCSMKNSKTGKYIRDQAVQYLLAEILVQQIAKSLTITQLKIHKPFLSGIQQQDCLHFATGFLNACKHCKSNQIFLIQRLQFLLLSLQSYCSPTFMCKCLQTYDGNCRTPR